MAILLAGDAIFTYMVKHKDPLILPYGDTRPEIHPTAFVAPTAVLIGETVVGARASVFFHCVLRGDINRVEVGAGTNIQDLCMLHVDDSQPCIIGRDVTVGHRAVIHGCVVEDRCLIGMGALVLNGAVIGADSVVAAGAVVPEGMQVPPGSLVAGVPAQIKRELPAQVIESLPRSAHKYVKVARAYLTGRPFRPNLGIDIELE